MADYFAILHDESVQRRFWAKVDKRGPEECWEWQAQISPAGYGRFKIGERGHQAHRLSLLTAGFIPSEGDVADHICRNRACVNPSHLRFVTQKVNAMENSVGIAATNAVKTHCKRGHPLFGENLKLNAIGGRICRTCERARCREYMRGIAAKARALREQEQNAA